MKKYFQYLILLSIISCANNEKVAAPKNYSDDTNRAFEMIERGGSYYLKKAPTYTAPPKIETVERKTIVIDEKINYQAKPLTQEIRSNPQTEIIKPNLKSTRSSYKTDERLIEINQNLAFYCMKHRNNPAYGGNEAKCMKFVNKVMINCQNQHRIVNSKLLSCIQKKLKK